ncbi:heterokaryon incompatibility protein-domain-containing protein [Xylariaceae sp. FL1272]|nr:heterokaryon incompatibility protein-domain-containing protein [Xylariaceae sp. FL1272]
MRLIHCKTLQLEEVTGHNIPPYVILSHTWEEEEVSLSEFSRAAGSESDCTSKGWEKIKQTCNRAISQEYEYAWIDTCCIDKSSSAELEEAINSMFAWYAGAAICFAYLSDFHSISDSKTSTPGARLFSSRWFSRGWTLQELIAPAEVDFYDSSWTFYSSRATRSADIAFATGIDEAVLLPAGRNVQQLLSKIPVCQKMSWAASRKTTRLEDTAYCLLGIFGVNMPLIYGEGMRAFFRLQEEIIKSKNDLTILAWKSLPEGAPWAHTGALAQSPKQFVGSQDIVLSQSLNYNPDFTVTNKGIRITVSLPTTSGIEKPTMSLHCHHRERPHEPLGIYLASMSGDVFSRAHSHVIPIEREGQRAIDSSIFLATDTMQETVISSALAHRGHHFSFKHVSAPDMANPFRILSSHPERRWDDGFGFRAKDATFFVGYNTYEALWRDGAWRFVVACGFDSERPPWACVSFEGSDLWRAAVQRDSLRIRDLAAEEQLDEVLIQPRRYISVSLKPFWSEDDDNDEPRWMQVEVRTGRKSKDTRLKNAERCQRRLGFSDRQQRLLPEPESNHDHLRLQQQ